MRTGIFGGTFNPIHNGHIKLARAYRSELELDRMLVIPTRIPPHKVSTELADGKDRLQMCRLAFAGQPEFEVSDIELCRTEPSYTVDTLEALHARWPEDELFLLTGSDMFLTLTEWRRWERLFELAVMCVGEREPNLFGRLQTYGRYLESLGARCRVIDIDPVQVSSTEVRERVHLGLPIDRLVPPAVAAYIAERQLYHGST